MTDYKSAALTSADRVIIEYCARLTAMPNRIRPEDISLLREHGFGDRAIHDICAITAYFAFVNRIAHGLGVELEDSGRFNFDL